MIIKKDQDSIKSYFEDSSNLKGGHAEQVVIPENTVELAAFMADCNKIRMPVTVSGGGTATTGSRIPFGGAIVSLEKLNRFMGLSKETMCVAVEAGASVDDLKKAADGEDLFYPSHPTEGNASVGGTVSTNASGSRSFKYGPTRDYVRRLKMVLADGRILDIRRGATKLTKDNSRIITETGICIQVPVPSYIMPDSKTSCGYYAKDGMDAIDLFIGQEGTLSVITEVELGLVKKPFKILSVFVFFANEEDAWGFAEEARDASRANKYRASHSGLNALSIEYFDSNALSMLRQRDVNIPESAKGAIFFEQDTSASQDEGLIVEEWIGLIAKYGVSTGNTWVAMSERDAERFTGIRYAVPEAVNDKIRSRAFRKFSTDISVPDHKSREMMKYYSDIFISNPIEHLIFGHLGENHVHVNIIPGSEKEALMASDIIMKLVKKGISLGGAVSAEHGIGKLKHGYLQEMYGLKGIKEMVILKKAFDPNSILGVGNIFPRELLNSR